MTNTREEIIAKLLRDNGFTSADGTVIYHGTKEVIAAILSTEAAPSEPVAYLREFHWRNNKTSLAIALADDPAAFPVYRDHPPAQPDTTKSAQEHDGCCGEYLWNAPASKCKNCPRDTKSGSEG